MGKHKYPLSILPQKSYIVKIDIDNLYQKILPLFVVRRSGDVLDKFGNLKERDVLNMSMNLLGESFKSEHIQYNPTGESSKKWDGQESIDYLQYCDLVQHIPNAIPIFFEVNKLHNVDIPYNRTKEKDLDKIINSFDSKPIESNGHYKLCGKGIISHEPTRLNFWHVEFQIKDFQNSLVKDTKTAWKKYIAETALTIVTTSATNTCGEITLIPEHFFRKQ